MANTSLINGAQVNGSPDGNTLNLTLKLSTQDGFIAARAVTALDRSALGDSVAQITAIEPVIGLLVAGPLGVTYTPKPSVTDRLLAGIPVLPVALVEQAIISEINSGYALSSQATANLIGGTADHLMIEAYYSIAALLASEAGDSAKPATVARIVDLLAAFVEGKIPEVVAIEEIYLLSTVDGLTRQDTEALLDIVAGRSSVSLGMVSSLLSAASSVLQAQDTLTVLATATADGTAGDTTDTAAHYSQRLGLFAGAYVSFRLSGDLVQGWVMNMEGDRPISEYREFDFNSFAVVNGVYYAAGDQGLYVMGESDTDDGQPIDASLRTMMLDFDTTKQKRVVAAYLGYTASGELLLKIRSVDDGVLVEQWYEATGTQADAPQEGYRQLGRGMKSRYWQFELVNVDGADFEVDKLEVLPIQLSRRV